MNTSRAPIVVRPLTSGDATAFVDFISLVPEGERRFLKEDLHDPNSAFEGYLRPTGAHRVVAVTGAGEIAGLAGAFPGEGWSSHVAELRVLVSGGHRGRGVGRLLARAALLEALQLGCTHVFVELVAEQEALVAMFQDLGFVPEALLPDFVRDGAGEFHDLMLLTHRALDQLSSQRIVGLEEVLA